MRSTLEEDRDLRSFIWQLGVALDHMRRLKYCPNMHKILPPKKPRVATVFNDVLPPRMRPALCVDNTQPRTCNCLVKTTRDSVSLPYVSVLDPLRIRGETGYYVPV